MVPTSNQIAAQVEAVLARDAQARCIAIRSPVSDTWPESLLVRHRSFRLHWCPSSLAVRQALMAVDGPTSEGLVVLTQLGDADLGSDLVARLARQRVFQVDPWDMVRQVFQATEIDARLAKKTWLAQALLEYLPVEGYPPVPGGFLDLETAWRQVLGGSLGLAAARPDLVGLLRWTLTADGARRFAGLPAEVQPQVAEWLADCAGPAGELVMGALGCGRGADALPIGLICDLVFAPDDSRDGGGRAASGAAAEGAGQPELAAAAVRLERFTGNRRLAPEPGRRWGEAAVWLLRSLSGDEARPVLERAEALLGELHLAQLAGLSAVLPSGFDARLAGVGAAIDALLVQPSPAALAAVEQAAALALAHDLGAGLRTRSERVRMARRLARWLVATPVPTPQGQGLDALVQGYARDAAYVDWARLKLLGGDELAALSAAYGALADGVRERREAFNRRFAAALQAWNRDPAPLPGCLPVELVLERLLGPLAQQTPVLLLVVDGLSCPIFLELCADLAGAGWVELIPEGTTGPQVALAALPTVTEVSRASLLSGALTIGASHQEKSAFAAHPALLAASRAGGKPVLFHKGELGDASGLSQQVREVVGSPARKLVGVVYNAVDDHLSGPDQLHLRWNLDDLRLLRPLLHEARLAGRALIITADHGHVIDEQTLQRSAQDGDRWRGPVGPVQPDEILLEGGRVRAPGGGARVVCAWSEHLRYGGKKNGYHGGASPQEVLVPLSVLVPPLVELDGWRQAPPGQPEWWEYVLAMPAAMPPAAPAVPKPRRRRKDEITGDLFGDEAPVAQADWIGALLVSPTYRQQRQLAARVAPQDSEMRALLEALDARGGKLGKAALAQRLGMPMVRLSGFINAARRILNLDQAAVLSLDEAAAQIDLNRELLEVQFQLRLHRR